MGHFAQKHSLRGSRIAAYAVLLARIFAQTTRIADQRGRLRVEAIRLASSEFHHP